jgi:hypothetical protein
MVARFFGGESRIRAAAARAAAWVFGHGDRVQEWRGVARRCGLTNVREVGMLGRTYRLEADAVSLHVVFTSAALSTREAPRGTLVIGAVANGLHAPTEPRLRIGGLDVPMNAADMPPVGGPPLLLCALLDAPARRIVAGLFEGRVEGDDGIERSWRCEVRLRDGALTIDYHGELFDEALQGALNAARCLAATDDPARAAADALRRETWPALRAYILRALAAEAPDHPATTAAVRAALTDGSPAMRLEAALASGTEGRAVLHALAASEDTTEEVQARVVTALGADLPSHEVHTLLERAIARRRTRVAIGCLELLGTRGPDETAVLARALKCGDPGVVVAAAQALTWHGNTREAVIALREAETLWRGDRDLADAVRHAVVAIQLRLESAGTGQLSVAGAEAGTLALTDDGRGRVALDAPSKDVVR